MVNIMALGQKGLIRGQDTYCCSLRISPHQSTLPCLGYEAHQGVTNINNNNSQSNNNIGYHCPVCLPCPGSSDPAIPPREASLTFW